MRLQKPCGYKGRLVTEIVWLQSPFGYKGGFVIKAVWLQRPFGYSKLHRALSFGRVKGGQVAPRPPGRVERRGVLCYLVRAGAARKPRARHSAAFAHARACDTLCARAVARSRDTTPLGDFIKDHH